MSEIPGFGEGFRAANEDYQSQEMFKLSKQGAQQKLELGDISIQQEKTKLQASQFALESQQQMIQMMKSQAGGTTNDPSKPSNDLAGSLDQMAQIALRSGQPEQAGKYGKDASEIRKNNVEITARQAKEADGQLTLAANLLTHVKDQRSWEQAIDMYKLQVGHNDPAHQDLFTQLSSLPYSPEIVQKIKDAVTSEKDKALTAAATARVAASRAEVQERTARVSLIQAQKKITQDRDEALLKAGAVTKIPKEGDLKAITDLLVGDYGAGVLPEDARVMARPVAERMMELIQTNKLSRSEAAVQAYREAKDAGSFGGLKPRPMMKGNIHKPLEMPMNGKKVDTTKMKENMWYNYKGTPMLLMKGKLYSQDELAAGDHDAG